MKTNTFKAILIAITTGLVMVTIDILFDDFLLAVFYGISVGFFVGSICNFNTAGQKKMFTIILHCVGIVLLVISNAILIQNLLKTVVVSVSLITIFSGLFIFFVCFKQKN